MDVDEWLERRRQDYRGAEKDLRPAIADFILVWSLFEFTVLEPANKKLARLAHERTEGYKRNYFDVVEEAARSGVGDITKFKPFSTAYDYFRTRHYNGVNLTNLFTELTEYTGRAAARIEEVYADEPPDYRTKVEALFHVAYCLRTNLVHGYKWHSGLAGQSDNFRHATVVLMLAVDHAE